MRTEVLATLSFYCLFSALGWAQEPGGSGGGGGQGSSDSGGRRPQTRSRRNQQFQRPIFLSGQVMLDDGSAPIGQVAVDLVCQGAVVRQAYASTGGTFSFQLSTGRGQQNSLQSLDASVSSSQYGGPLGGGTGGATSGPLGRDTPQTRTGSLNLSACELVAELAGFQSERITLGPRRALDNPDVGVLVLHRTVVPASGTVSVKALTAPKKATKSFEKAGKELKKRKSIFPR